MALQLALTKAIPKMVLDLGWFSLVERQPASLEKAATATAPQHHRSRPQKTLGCSVEVMDKSKAAESDAILIFRNNIVPRLHRLFSVHKPDRSNTMIKNTTQTIFKVGDKLLKSNAKNSHRMGGKPWLGPYIIQKDLGKGRYCLKTLEGKALKQTIHYACLKRFLDPVVEEDIVDEVEELDNSGSECGNANDIASEQEAADGKGIGDSLDHEENEYYKEQGCQNEQQKSHSPEYHKILEPASVLEEQLYSPNFLRLWRSGACTSHYEAKEDDKFDVNSI
eukprot:Em0014g500a